MYNGTVKSLSYAVRAGVVFKYFGQFCLVAAALTSVSFAVSLFFGEYDLSLRYAAVIAVQVTTGFLLGRRRAPRGGIQNNEAMVLTALVFMFMSVLFTFVMLGGGLTLDDAFFEAVSGVTTTGLSTLSTLENKPRTFLFARAWLQWSGGLGIVVLTVALISGPGVVARRLVDFGETNDLVGSTRIYARRILIVYALLTVGGFLLILLSGVAPFTAFIHTLAAISTGGFSSYDRSLEGLGGWGPRTAVMGVSALGAISLALYYKIYRDGPAVLRTDIQLKAIVALALISTGLLWAVFLITQSVDNSTGGHAALMAISAQTTTGFSTLDVGELDQAAKLVMILSMVIGGGIGSTAGGIKTLRLLIVLRMIKLIFDRSCLPEHAVLEPSLAGTKLKRGEIEHALLLVILFCLVIFVSWLPFVIMGYDPLDSLFEVVSATGTVGLSAGITSIDLPVFLKMVLCADMLMGRLEIVALLVLFYPRTWLGRRM